LALYASFISTVQASLCGTSLTNKASDVTVSVCQWQFK